MVAGLGLGTALAGSKLSLTSCLLVLAKELIPDGMSPSRFVLRKITAFGNGAYGQPARGLVSSNKQKHRIRVTM